MKHQVLFACTLVTKFVRSCLGALLHKQKISIKNSITFLISNGFYLIQIFGKLNAWYKFTEFCLPKSKLDTLL